MPFMAFQQCSEDPPESWSTPTKDSRCLITTCKTLFLVLI